MSTVITLVVVWIVISLAFGTFWGLCGFMWNKRRAYDAQSHSGVSGMQEFVSSDVV